MRSIVRTIVTCVLLYDLLHSTTAPRGRTAGWLVGYKSLFLLASFHGLFLLIGSHSSFVLNEIKTLQYNTLHVGRRDRDNLTRSIRAEHTESDSHRLASRAHAALLEPYNDRKRAPLCWYLITCAFLIYNTLHLIAAPMQDLCPLFFGVPAGTLYWITIRVWQIGYGRG